MDYLCSKLDSLYFAAKNGLYNFFTKEDGEVNVVATVLLIGVAVILVVVFKDAIKTLLETLLETITGKATEAVSGD